MVYYGPWLQPPDRELEAAQSLAFWRTVVVGGEAVGWEQVSPAAETVYGVQDNTIEWSGDPIPHDPAAFIGWVLDEGAIAGGSDPGVPASPRFSVSHANTQGLPGSHPGDPSDPTPYFDAHSAERGVSGMLNHTTVDDLMWDDAWRADLPPEEQWPDGAVQYEVEERLVDGDLIPAATVLSAALRVAGETRAFEGHIAPVELVATVDARWLTEGVKRLEWALDEAGGLAFLRTYDIAAGINPVDITMTIENPGSDPVGPGLVAPLAMWQCIRTVPGAGGGSVTLTGTYTAGSATVLYAAEDSTTYTIRPPRIRWVYETVPYRRNFPRDDALAGGAGRNWPRPKSSQASNRTSGGYL